MALVSISTAARLAGLSRTQLYRGYLDQGKITTVTDGDNMPKIDTAELIRVFGELRNTDVTEQRDPLRPVTPPRPVIDAAILHKQEIAHLRTLLQEKDAQLQLWRDRVTELNRTINVLMHTPSAPTAAPEPAAAVPLAPAPPLVAAVPPGSEAFLPHLNAPPTTESAPTAAAPDLLRQVTADQPERRTWWARLFGGR